MTAEDKQNLFPPDLSFNPLLPTASDPDSALPCPPLPPGMLPKDFELFLKQLKEILGPAYVFRAAAQVAQYSRPFQHSPDGECWASAAVAPADLEQLRQVVARCQEHRVPVWPISHGRNFGYGSARPATTGQIILDLQRMNRILEINTQLGYIVCEPGVMYSEIKRHLSNQGAPFWISLPDLGPLTGPVGNALEHGVGYTPYGDHFLSTCGMEVLLSDGTLFRTGTGSVSESQTAHVYKWGMGPYLDGLFTQSNFGIVTKLGIWLMPEPEQTLPFAALLWQDDAIVEYIDATRELLMKNFIQSTVTLGQFRCNLNQLGPRRHLWKENGPVSDERAERIREHIGAPVWTSFGALYGNSNVVSEQWKLVTERLSAISNLELVTADNLDSYPYLGTLFEHRSSSMRGDGYSELLEETVGWRENGGIVWFSPVLPTIGKQIQKEHKLAKRIILDHGLDPMTGYIVRERYVHHLISLVFDRTSTDERHRVQRCYQALLDAHTQLGYPVYRAPVTMMNTVAETYDPHLRKIWSRIKQALDPSGIIAPGKSGIDP